MINVTKTYLPPFDEYTAILERAWKKGWMTNNGELVQELEAKLKDFLGVEHLLFCSNGTIVLQMAIKAFGLTKEIITTPFSYVATANVIAWEGCTPVFVDIEPETFTIDPTKIEAAINENTEAILATHVYGFPCKIEAIQTIADKYQLKVIYDGAHAFGCTYKDKSLLGYGDISTCSFHATKVMHTVEGGCIITNNEKVYDWLYKTRAFGHFGDEYFQIGINAKNTEVHAAMGLASLPYFNTSRLRREQLVKYYSERIKDEYLFNFLDYEFATFNYGYFPVLLPSEAILLNVIESLRNIDIYPRRYFFPSLNILNQFKFFYSCPISEDVSKRILCLPMGHDVTEKIANMVIHCIQKY